MLSLTNAFSHQYFLSRLSFLQSHRHHQRREQHEDGKLVAGGFAKPTASFQARCRDKVLNNGPSPPTKVLSHCPCALSHYPPLNSPSVHPHTARALSYWPSLNSPIACAFIQALFCLLHWVTFLPLLCRPKARPPTECSREARSRSAGRKGFRTTKSRQQV